MSQESVFLVQHLRSVRDSEDVKLIGVYTSRAEAEAAVARKRQYPGFSRFPHIVEIDNDQKESGFYIDEYSLNEDQWSEGFGV